MSMGMGMVDGRRVMLFDWSVAKELMKRGRICNRVVDHESNSELPIHGWCWGGGVSGIGYITLMDKLGTLQGPGGAMYDGMCTWLGGIPQELMDSIDWYELPSDHRIYAACKQTPAKIKDVGRDELIAMAQQTPVLEVLEKQQPAPPKLRIGCAVGTNRPLLHTSETGTNRDRRRDCIRARAVEMVREFVQYQHLDHPVTEYCSIQVKPYHTDVFVGMNGENGEGEILQIPDQWVLLDARDAVKQAVAHAYERDEAWRKLRLHPWWKKALADAELSRQGHAVDFSKYFPMTINEAEFNKP